MMRQYELVERVQKYKPDVNEALLNKAYVYAMQKHGQQKRASGDPYISHPLEVAAILTEMHLDESTIAVALLHDTIEDTTATRAEIDDLFGEDIGALVEGLTKIKKLDLVTKKAKQAENLRKLLLAISRGRARAARQARRPAAQHAHPAITCRRKSARGSPRRRWISMRRSPGAWACRTCANELEDLSFKPSCNPEALSRRSPRRLDELSRPHITKG
jgi:GTP diphosphokinase / guanosine-3',5'-bis(diphosphate) 3'-diphosphatase